MGCHDIQLEELCSTWSLEAGEMVATQAGLSPVDRPRRGGPSRREGHQPKKPVTAVPQT